MFLILGGVGALLLLIGLIFGDAIEGVLPENDWLSLTAIATFLVAFGFGAYLIQSGTGAPAAVAATGGAVAGIGMGYVALRWSRSLATMATDATPTAADLVGCQGRIITSVPAGSTGEVLVQLGGLPMKLTAVPAAGCEGSLERGTEIIVVSVLSPTKVEVQAADAFWNQ